MLHKLPKTFAILASFFVVGVLVYAAKFHLQRQPLQGTLFLGNTASRTTQSAASKPRGYACCRDNKLGAGSCDAGACPTGKAIDGYYNSETQCNESSCKKTNNTNAFFTCCRDVLGKGSCQKGACPSGQAPDGESLDSLSACIPGCSQTTKPPELSKCCVGSNRKACILANKACDPGMSATQQTYVGTDACVAGCLSDNPPPPPPQPNVFFCCYKKGVTSSDPIITCPQTHQCPYGMTLTGKNGYSTADKCQNECYASLVHPTSANAR